MRVMWAVAALMGKCGAAFGVTQLGSGGWIDACAEQLKPMRISEELELHIVALSGKDDYCYDENDKIHYHLLNNPQNRGCAAPNNQVKKWKECIEKIKPDIIQVWGTEYSMGFDIQKVAGEIPVIFFIQGIMGSITEHPNGDMRLRELLHGADIMLLPKLLKMHLESRKIKKQVKLERQMIKKCQGIILDSEWAKAQYAYANVATYMVPLPINNCFRQKKWNPEKNDGHKIFTVAGRTPLKGLHILIKAILLVKEKYPNVLLEIPGNVESKKPHFLFEPIYLRYLRRLIKNNNLEENVRFLGKLSQEQMADYMSGANVFVMPSCIENHSSTLREAMTTGCPCVTSDVGSVLEFARHEENALVYRYNEVQTLANYITRIFSNVSYSKSLGANAKETISKKYDQNIIGHSFIKTYYAVLKYD